MLNETELPKCISLIGDHVVITGPEFDALISTVRSQRDLMEEQRRTIQALMMGVEEHTGKEGTTPVLRYIGELESTVRELQRQVQEREADARRLEWLEVLFEKRWNAVIDSGSRTYWSIWNGHRNRTREMEGRTFREAIDKAMNIPKETP